MAYETTALKLVFDPRDGDTSAQWAYQTTDSPDAVAASGYFADASNKGMKLGDVIDIQETDNAYASVRATVSVIASGVGTVQLPAGGTKMAVEGGSGIVGVAALYATSVERIGGIIRTTILIDLTGLSSGGTAADIIGDNGQANCHLGQVTLARNGAIFGGYMTCLETPATGEPDIDLYSADESTGVEDAAITGLTETVIQAVAGDWTIAVVPKAFGAIAADQFLYLVASGVPAANTYTAGKFEIVLLGL